MQKIAYSTLAIAAPVVLQGCSEEDEQTAPDVTEVDCSTLAETECTALENAQCNWNQLESVPENCSSPEDFRDTLASFNDNPEGCTQYGGVRVQPCKKIKECSDYVLSSESSNPIWDDLGQDRKSAKLEFSEIKNALTDALAVVFWNGSTDDFRTVQDDAGNPDTVCRGYLTPNALNGTLNLCANADCSAVSFDCYSATAPGNSIALLSVPDGAEIQINEFADNMVFDAEFYDACNTDTMCGMNLLDGTCQPIENFCAQFAENGDTCPDEYEKDNVGFLRGTDDNGNEIEVITNAVVCEHLHKINDPILDEVTGEPTGELYAENIGCQTAESLAESLVTCEASPFPSFGLFDAVNPIAELDPLNPVLSPVPAEEMCNLWLADDQEWEGDSQSARPIYDCETATGTPGFRAGSNVVVCFAEDGTTELEPGPALSATGRACGMVGDRSENGLVKECALPREFSCGTPLDNADAGEECIKTNICVYDNGARFECANSFDVDGVRGPDDDTE